MRTLRTLLAGALLAVGLLAVAGPAATAGGWAVTTLDPLDAQHGPVAGRPVTVGFTIRQHGVTPVALDGVAIAVRAADGAELVFPAAPSGAVGHYVASVTFPEAGMFTWEARPGWFGPQALGAVEVERAPAGRAGFRWPLAARLALPALALVFVAAAVAPRRPRRAAAVAG